MYQAIPYSAGRLPSWPRRAAPMASTAEPEVAGAADQGTLDAAGARDGGGGGEEGRGGEPGGGGGEARIADEAELAALATAEGEVAALPAVFVGGRLLGGLGQAHGRPTSPASSCPSSRAPGRSGSERNPCTMHDPWTE
ncbi:hypothetical protein ACQ4PT_070578 [Festuca glaucescens]